MDERLKFLTDEDVPRSTARILREAGFDAVDVRDVGLRGKPDDLIFQFAQREERLIVTCDMGFSNILRFPPSKHHGILVVRIPDSEPVNIFNREVLHVIQEAGEKLTHHLAIIQLGKVRLRG